METLSKVFEDKYNNPVMIYKIFVRLTAACSFCTYVEKPHWPAEIS